MNPTNSLFLPLYMCLSTAVYFRREQGFKGRDLWRHNEQQHIHTHE